VTANPSPEAWLHLDKDTTQGIADERISVLATRFSPGLVHHWATSRGKYDDGKPFHTLETEELSYPVSCVDSIQTRSLSTELVW